MNTNTTLIGGVIVVLLLVGGVFLYMQSNPSPASTISTSTPTGTTGNNTNAVPETPLAPGSPRATTNSTVSTTDNTAGVVGGVVPNGAFTTYRFEYGVTDALGSQTASQNIGSGYTELAAPIYITGLQKDTTYYFRISAQNQYGTSAGVTYTFHTTVGTPPPVGSAPAARTLAASSIVRTAATISGSVTPNKAATTYWFEYGKTQGLGQIASVQPAGSGSASLPVSASLSSLDPLTTYYFRLNAQNQFGTVNGAVLNFKTTGPSALSAPAGVTRTANAVGTSTATLRGSITVVSEATFYWFEYSTDAGFASASLITTAQKSVAVSTGTISVEANVSALQSGTTYHYRIAVQNSVGTVRGASVSFKTK